FFPMHPLMLGLLTRATGASSLVVGAVLDLVLGAVATLLVWRVAGRLAGRVVADRSAILFCFFPGAFSLSLIYAEPLMLVGLAGCLLALLNRRWVLAGVAGLVATASRPNACVILIACAWAAVTAVRRRRDWRAVTAPVLAAGGIGGYFLYLWLHSGSATAWFRSEKVMWHDHMTLTAVATYVRQLVTRAPSLRGSGLDPLIVVLGLILIGAALFALRRVHWPAPVVAYTAAALLIPLTSVAVGPRPRILMAAFPVAILAAQRLRGRAFVAVTLASAVALGLLTFVTATSLAITP
ncbi:MAG TPA: hypothetical protein VGR90_05715, partial [Acidimicrobiales bacterium]|nr:hypothetical protein [Acidimicrobiales bacterium]